MARPVEEGVEVMSILSNSLMILGVSFALAVSACGDDDDDGGGSEGGADASMPRADAEPGGATCPDHPNLTEGAGGVCSISGGANAPITQDLRLVAGKEYLLNGPVFIGDDSAETVLTIDAGVTVYGGAGSFLLIQRNSKIMAVGTADAPIVLTSAKAAGTRGASDWGGLVINGKAPINNADAADGSAPGEAGTGRYGGNTSNDSSGVLKYVRVEFAGNKVDDENELNGIAFQGVGAGTEVDFVQTHMTSDDGVEFFGGTVNVKHLVVTGADDDCIDWTGGWRGKIQFAIAQQLPESGPEAERGVEADNLEANNSATPFSSPILSNVTLISRTGNTAEGMRLRRGTKGQLWNFIVKGFGGFCARVSETQTEANVDDGSLAVQNHVYECGTGAASTGKGEEMINRDGAQVLTADPMLGADWQPAAGSPALGIGAGPTDSFFDTVDYAGAFDGTIDWAAGWIEPAVN
jgi:hypothetical protein